MYQIKQSQNCTNFITIVIIIFRRWYISAKQTDQKTWKNLGDKTLMQNLQEYFLQVVSHKYDLTIFVKSVNIKTIELTR